MNAIPEFQLKAIDLLLKKDYLRMWVEVFKIPSFLVPYLILHKKRAERCLISTRGKKKPFQMYDNTFLQKEPFPNRKGLVGLPTATRTFRAADFTDGAGRRGPFLMEHISSGLWFAART